MFSCKLGTEDWHPNTLGQETLRTRSENWFSPNMGENKAEDLRFFQQGPQPEAPVRGQVHPEETALHPVLAGPGPWASPPSSQAADKTRGEVGKCVRSRSRH